MRLSVAITLACLTLVGLSAADESQASIKNYTDIPAEELGTALQTLAKDRNFQIIYVSEEINALHTQGAVGEFTSEDALKQLLKGTGLTFRYLDANTVTVVPIAAVAPPEDSGSAPGKTMNDKETAKAKPTAEAGDSKKSLWDRLRLVRLAQLDQGAPSGSSAVEATAQASQRRPEQLEEVVVTAQKRDERLIDVPMSLTALSGAQLENTQSYRLEDYVGKVPGLMIVDYGALGSQLVVRGITTGSGPINSSVATYVDETPYTAQGPFAAAGLISPNLDTFDMQRIEVLRGPQGTLYGANALAGLLKYVTNAPDPSGFAAAVETGGSSVYSGPTGFDVHGMVNVPLTSDAALRVVGYDNYYPGFIDDPSRGLKDTNGTHFAGGRASLLYDPTTDFSIRFNALYQDRSWGDWSNEDVRPGTLKPIFGNLIQENFINQPGDAKAQLYNITMNWDAGFAKLLSTTSYSKYQLHSSIDYSKVFGPILGAIFGTPFGATFEDNTTVHTFTQEVRLSSANANKVQWQVGGYFTNESGIEFEPFYPIDAKTKAILYTFQPNLGIVEVPTTYREYAGFANLEYHITPTFDVAAGGRYSKNNQTFHETFTGLLSGAGLDFGNASSEGVFTYSGDVRWHVTPQSMLYARIAEGFVPGGPNDAIPGSTLPSSYSSSTTVNYEAGIKSNLLDHRLTLEVSAFDVNWRHIQLDAIIGGIGTIANGGTARSDGVEFDIGYVPIRGLTLGLNGAFTNAYLTAPAPASVNGKTGDRLPAVPLWQSSASASYEQPLVGDLSGFAGVDWRFTGSRFADFEPAGPRQKMPSFNIFDLRAGMKTQRWSFSLYVKNVGNEIAINYVQNATLSAGGLGPQSAVVYTPRTFGATLTARF